jgi:predicted TIM-barrel fold metal-dependent hydrolase
MLVEPATVLLIAPASTPEAPMTASTKQRPSERPLDPEVDRSIPFVDAHHHLWELSRFPYGWLQGPSENDVLGDFRGLGVDWGPDRLFREFHGQHVIKSVHVEAGYSGTDAVEETAWLESVARTFGLPNALIVAAPLDAPDAEDELDRHQAASALVRGVRPPVRPDDPASGEVRGAFRALQRRGLSWELNATPDALPAGRAMAAAFPEVQVILGNAGFPLERTPAYFERWRGEIRALAALDNVACKVSGLASVDHAWTVASLRPWVLAIIDAFGAERVMFGSNWPVDGLYAPYIEQVDAWRRILIDAGCTREEQARLLHGNAERLYRI